MSRFNRRLEKAVLLTISAVLFACEPKTLINDVPTQDDVIYPDLPELDDIITQEMSDASIPGLSACIVNSGAVAWCNGYGFANLETGQTVTSTTPFMLASISKTVTGVALLQVVSDGLLSLDDPINDHLGFSVHHPTDSTPITARMLLGHTSGIDDNWGVMNAMIVNGDSPLALGDFMEGYLTPEGQWYDADRNFVSNGVVAVKEYSNVGAALAGHLVEAVTGEDFAAYTADNIFEPLGMERTGWFVSDFDESELAVPYEWYDDEWHAVAHYGYPDYPDGSLRTGAEQLATFLLMFSNGGALNGNTVLPVEGVNEMKTVHYPDLDRKQGLIWYYWTVSGTVVIGHNGGDLGVSTEFGVSDDGTGFVILMNGSGIGGTFNRLESAMLEAAASL